MVRLEEVEDETFFDKPEATRDGALLVDEDDADYTDTDSEISEDSFSEPTYLDESLSERISALRDIIPPKTRAKIVSVASTTYSAAAKTVTFGGKAAWVVCTSMLLLGLPYALAFQEEQMVQEEERQRQLMSEGASGLMATGAEETKPAV